MGYFFFLMSNFLGGTVGSSIMEPSYDETSDCNCYFHFRKFFSILALGQLLSWLLCGTGVFSQLLVTNHGIEIPTTQSFLNYLLLGIVYTTALACHPSDFKTTLTERGWKYFLLALFDVEANYLVVKAYQYTNLTSIQVSNCSLLTILFIINSLLDQ